MENSSVQLKISLVNVPDSISALKLRGYLRAEAQDIQNSSEEQSFVVMRVFLPRRILFAYTQKKLDVLFEDIVNKTPCIHRIELVVSDHALDAAQFMAEAATAKTDMAQMIEDAKEVAADLESHNQTLH